MNTYKLKRKKLIKSIFFIKAEFFIREFFFNLKFRALAKISKCCVDFNVAYFKEIAEKHLNKNIF